MTNQTKTSLALQAAAVVLAVTAAAAPAAAQAVAVPITPAEQTDFMTNLANPEIGGYFGVVRGNGPALGPAIVAAVRDRFNQMYVVRWRVSCVAPTVNQTFNLVFKVEPPIAPDGYRDVPVGIDPSIWPLDVDRTYTVADAKRNPVTPGSTSWRRACCGE